MIAALKLLPWRYIGAALAIIGFVLWLRGLQHKVSAQATEITALRSDLANEKQARERDVSGLTTLSQGLLAASSAKTADQKALSNAINAQNPQPVSSGLASFLACLSATDAGKQCAGAASSITGKPVIAAASPH